MYEKIINVYYGQDCLPYKDKERQVHFPIVGGSFLGASDTTKIRFYFDRIGNANVTWVAITKLPNGKQGSKVFLEISTDSEINEHYCELALSNWYTQAKGDVFIALQGYQGGVIYRYDSESGLYTISGTPTIQTTGSIKLSINYAPIGDSPDYNDEFTTFQQILAALGDKLDINNGILVVNDISQLTPSSYDEGQVFYDLNTKALYRRNGDYFTKFFETYDKTSINSLLNTKADKSDTYTKSETNTLLDAKADKSDTYTKAQTDSAIASAITNVYRYKGSVPTYDDLPTSGMTVGDVYNIEDSGDNYAWTGTEWDKLASSVLDLRNYYNKDQSDARYSQATNVENGSNQNPGTLKMLTESETWNGIDIDGNTHEYTTGAFGKYALQTGGKSCAMGERSIAGGTKTYAGKGALAIGDTTHAEDFAVSAGYKTVAKGYYSHAEGYITKANGSSSHAEGTETIASGDYSHAEGGKSKTQSGFIVVDHNDSPYPSNPVEPSNPTIAEQDATNGAGTHAEGMETLAFAIGSHSAGVYSKAYNRYSHTEGYNTQAGELVLRKTEDNKDYYSVDHAKHSQHAEGIETKATGHGSHAGGIGTIADKDYSTAIGKYGVATNTSDALFSVGNGIDNANRIDAFEVLADGTAKIGAMGSNNLSVATKQYVDSNISNVREVAEGKCKTLIISYQETIATLKESILGGTRVYYMLQGGTYYEITQQVADGAWDEMSIANGDFNTQDASLSFSNKYLIYYDNGDAYCCLERYIPDVLNKGDIVLVKELQVPDRWVDIGEPCVFYALETSKIDLRNYPTLTGYNTFTHTNTFTDIITQNVYPVTRNTYSLGIMSIPYKEIVLSNRIRFDLGNGSSKDISFDASNNFVFDSPLLPSATNTNDLGTSSYAWKDLYLGDAIKMKNASATYFWDILVDNSNNLVVKNSSDGTTFTNVAYFDNSSKLHINDILPRTNSTYDLGSTSLKWQNLFISNHLSDGSGSIPSINSAARTIKGLCGGYIFVNPSSNMIILEYDRETSSIISADTTVDLDTQAEPANSYPEYRLDLMNEGASSHTITLPSGTKIKTNDDNITISGNTFVLPASTTVEINIKNTSSGLTAIVFNWAA